LKKLSISFVRDSRAVTLVVSTTSHLITDVKFWQQQWVTQPGGTTQLLCILMIFQALHEGKKLQVVSFQLYDHTALAML
jgi:hypothetical protein